MRTSIASLLPLVAVAASPTLEGLPVWGGIAASDNAFVAASHHLGLAEYLAAAGNFCAGIPVEALASGQLQIVDTDPGAPFDPVPSPTLLRVVIIQFLLVEEALQQAGPILPGDRSLLENRKHSLLTRLAELVNLSGVRFSPRSEDLHATR